MIQIIYVWIPDDSYSYLVFIMLETASHSAEDDSGNCDFDCTTDAIHSVFAWIDSAESRLPFHFDSVNSDFDSIEIDSEYDNPAFDSNEIDSHYILILRNLISILGIVNLSLSILILIMRIIF